MSARSVTNPRGEAAQDHRASIARVFRREALHEHVARCPDCGTETDVPAVAHAPRCPRFTVALSTGGGTEVAAVVQWERGRDGKKRSAKERNANGEITAGEMQRREEARADAAATTTRCALSDCDWTHTGTAATGRDQAVEHRRAAHPDLPQVKRARLAPLTKRPDPLDVGLAALQAMDAGDPQPVTVEPEPEFESNSKSAPEPDRTWSTKRKWTRESAIEAIQAFAREHGRPPLNRECTGNPALPSKGTISATLKTTLRAQAEALDVIATGIDQLATASE